MPWYLSRPKKKRKAKHLRKKANQEAELRLKKMDDDAGRPLTHRRLRGLSSPTMDGSPARGVDKRSNLMLSNKSRKRN
jgi:hypothetical protein